MNGTLLVDVSPGWSRISNQLVPGAHVVAIVEDELLALEGRCAGLELRDTLLVLSAGPRTRFAFIFRKPIAKVNVPAQMLDTATGGININGCRVASDSPPHRSVGPGFGSQTKANVAQGFRPKDYYAGTTFTYEPSALGRWPPNILLIHGNCRRIGLKSVRSDGHHPGRRGSAGVWSGEGGGLNGTEGPERYVGEDGLESVDAWECTAGCPVGLLDAMSGDRPSTLTGRADPTTTHDNPATAHPPNWLGTRTGGGGQVYADFGGASRFYPQFADESELHAWLNRLTNHG